MPRTVLFSTAECSACSSSESILDKFCVQCLLVKFVVFLFLFCVFSIYHFIVIHYRRRLQSQPHQPAGQSSTEISHTAKTGAVAVWLLLWIRIFVRTPPQTTPSTYSDTWFYNSCLGCLRICVNFNYCFTIDKYAGYNHIAYFDTWTLGTMS